MSRPRGGYIAGTLPAWTTISTSGVFTLREAQELRAANTWPRGPVAPTGLTASSGNAQLSLSWAAPATTHGTITNYLVEYTPSGGSSQYVLTNSTSTSYTLTGLTNGTAYTVRVAAVNFTAGDYSGTATRTAGAATVPGAPTNLSVTPAECPGGTPRASVTFTAPSDGGSPITHYRLQNTSSAVPYWEFAAAGGTSDRLVSIPGWPGFYGGSTVLLWAVNSVGSGAPVSIETFPTRDFYGSCPD